MKQSLQKESELFKNTSLSVLDHVAKSIKNNAVVMNKGHDGDFATQIDVSVENLIVEKIKELFPFDEIMAEEGYSDTVLGEGRTWVVDPICGTNNLARNIEMYCTNIALVENSQVVAACVVDFSCREFYWSVGGGVVYRGNNRFDLIDDADLGDVVDVDFGDLHRTGDSVKIKLLTAAQHLLVSRGFAVTSFNTSLSFLYAGIGKLSAEINTFAHPWDQFAGAFIAEQLGRVVTDLDGNPWTTSSRSMIIARDKDMHRTILESLKLGD